MIPHYKITEYKDLLAIISQQFEDASCEMQIEAAVVAAKHLMDKFELYEKAEDEEKFVTPKRNKTNQREPPPVKRQRKLQLSPGNVITLKVPESLKDVFELNID